MGGTHYFLIGNITIPSPWVAIVIGFIIGYLAIRFLFGKRVSEVLVDGIFYFVLVWKLSVILTQFEIVIKSPLTILYFNGGRVGIVLGLLAAGMKIVMEMRKQLVKPEDVKVLFLGVVIIQAVYQIVMVLVNEASLLIQLMTIISVVLFPLFVWMMIAKKKYDPIQLPILFIAVHFFVTAIQSVNLFSSMLIILISLFFIVIAKSKLMIKSEGTL